MEAQREVELVAGGGRRSYEMLLSFDYVDLFLIHWPLPTLCDGDFVSTWKALEEFHSDGREYGIATEAWSPIAQGGVLEDSTITRIAEKVGKTPAQVVLWWHIQRGDIVFPKSVTPSRIKENFELFDFELDPGDIDEISALDRGEDGRTGPNPDTFAYVPGNLSARGAL